MNQLIEQVYRGPIKAALALLPTWMTSWEAVALLLAIGLQESRLQFRAQLLAGNLDRKGPARGLWQFERMGGVHGVMMHPSTRFEATRACRIRHIPWEVSQIHAALEYDDVLAATFARLLLWSDPHHLPELDASAQDAWLYYTANWRPGKPHRETWDAYWSQAVNFVKGIQHEAG